MMLFEARRRGERNDDDDDDDDNDGSALQCNEITPTSSSFTHCFTLRRVDERGVRG